MNKRLLMIGAAAMLLVPLAKGETIAWYRFNEGTIGDRVGSSVTIENSANPGHLTGKCQYQDNASGALFDSEDDAQLPICTNAFPNGIGLVASAAKYANERALFFHTAWWDANHNNDYAETRNGSGVSVQWSSDFALSAFTAECFFKSSITNRQSSGNQTLVVMPGSTMEAISWSILVQNDGKLLAQMNSPSGFKQVSSSNNMSAHDGKWHHAAITFDGSTLRLYFDYAAAGSVSVDSAVYNDSTTLPLGIGCWPGKVSFRKWVGFIDEVRISDTVLSSTEFLHKAAYLPAADTADTACYVPFDYASLATLDGFAAESGLTDVNAGGYGAVTAKFTWHTTAGTAPTIETSTLPYSTLYGATFGNTWSYMSVTNTSSLYLTPGNTAGYSASLLVNDIVNNAHTVFNGSFTIEFFAKVPSAPSGNKFLMNLGRTLANSSLLYVWIPSGSTTLDFMMLPSGGSAVKVGSYAVTDFCNDQWHHLAISYDRSTLTATAFVDYRVVGSVTNLDFDYALTLSDSPAALQVNSAYGWRNLGFDGCWIDEFRLSRRALSRKELLAPTLNKYKGLMISFQ